MKKLIVTCIVLMMAVVAQAQTADEVIAKHLAARGGADKLASIKSMKIEGGLSVAGMDLPMVQNIVQGKGFRQDVPVNGETVTTAISGDKGWMVMPPMGVNTPTAMPEDQLKGAFLQSDISNGLLNYKETTATVDMGAKEGNDFKIKLTFKNGIAVTYFIDATSYNLSKVGIGGNEIKYSNYKAVDGIMIAHNTEVPNETVGIMAMTFTKVSLNVAIDEAIFAMPKN